MTKLYRVHIHKSHDRWYVHKVWTDGSGGFWNTLSWFTSWRGVREYCWNLSQTMRVE